MAPPKVEPKKAEVHLTEAPAHPEPKKKVVFDPLAADIAVSLGLGEVASSATAQSGFNSTGVGSGPLLGASHFTVPLSITARFLFSPKSGPFYMGIGGTFNTTVIGGLTDNAPGTATLIQTGPTASIGLNFTNPNKTFGIGILDINFSGVLSFIDGNTSIAGLDQHRLNGVGYGFLWNASPITLKWNIGRGSFRTSVNYSPASFMGSYSTLPNAVKEQELYDENRNPFRELDPTGQPAGDRSLTLTQLGVGTTIGVQFGRVIDSCGESESKSLQKSINELGHGFSRYIKNKDGKTVQDKVPGVEQLLSKHQQQLKTFEERLKSLGDLKEIVTTLQAQEVRRLRSAAYDTWMKIELNKLKEMKPPLSNEEIQKRLVAYSKTASPRLDALESQFKTQAEQRYNITKYQFKLPELPYYSQLSTRLAEAGIDCNALRALYESLRAELGKIADFGSAIENAMGDLNAYESSQDRLTAEVGTSLTGPLLFFPNAAPQESYMKPGTAKLEAIIKKHNLSDNFVKQDPPSTEDEVKKMQDQMIEVAKEIASDDDIAKLLFNISTDGEGKITLPEAKRLLLNQLTVNLIPTLLKFNGAFNFEGSYAKLSIQEKTKTRKGIRDLPLLGEVYTSKLGDAKANDTLARDRRVPIEKLIIKALGLVNPDRVSLTPVGERKAVFPESIKALTGMLAALNRGATTLRVDRDRLPSNLGVITGPEPLITDRAEELAQEKPEKKGEKDVSGKRKKPERKLRQ